MIISHQKMANMFNKELFGKICSLACSKKELEVFCAKIDKPEVDLVGSFSKYDIVDTIIRAIEMYEKGLIDNSYLSNWMNAYNWIIMSLIWCDCSNNRIFEFDDFIIWGISDKLDSLSFYDKEYSQDYNFGYMKNYFRTLDLILKTKDEWLACVACDSNAKEKYYDAFFLASNEGAKSYIKIYCDYMDLNKYLIQEKIVSIEEMRKRIATLKDNGYVNLLLSDEIEEFIYEELSANDMDREEYWNRKNICESEYKEKQVKMGDKRMDKLFDRLLDHNNDEQYETLLREIIGYIENYEEDKDTFYRRIEELLN